MLRRAFPSSLPFGHRTRKVPRMDPNPSRQPVVNDDADAAVPLTVPSDPNLPNVMVLGPMGGGVSSVVNLIAGEDLTPVSNDTPRCTKRMASYRIQLRDAATTVPITLYDIPGFDYTARPSLELPRVPISLAIVCMEDFPAQVRASVWYLQSEWRAHINDSVPVLVVINHISPRPDAGWWEKNAEHFPSVVTDHVCLTRRTEKESIEQLRSLIIQHLPAHNVHSRT